MTKENYQNLYQLDSALGVISVVTLWHNEKSIHQCTCHYQRHPPTTSRNSGMQPELLQAKPVTAGQTARRKICSRRRNTARQTSNSQAKRLERYGTITISPMNNISVSIWSIKQIQTWSLSSAQPLKNLRLIIDRSKGVARVALQHSC